MSASAFSFRVRARPATSSIRVDSGATRRPRCAANSSTSPPNGSRPPRISIRVVTPRSFNCATAAIAWCHRLSGLKRPILKRNAGALTAALTARTWAWLTLAIIDPGMPLGTTIGFTPQRHMMCFM